MKRSLVAPLLVCALLLPGCDVVESTGRPAVVKILGAGVASILWDPEAGEATIEPSGDDPQGLSFAADEDAIDDIAEEDAADDGGSGFYRINEPNGTVRFTSNLSEVPVDQRPKAERLAMAPSKPSGTRRAPAPRRETGQLAVAEEAQPPPARARSGSHEVVLYTTSWCGWCKKTRTWLDGKGVDYVDNDIERDEAAAAEMRDLTGGDSGVPVVVIDGEVIQGFDQRRMQSLLQI